MVGWSDKYGHAEYDMCKIFNGDYKLYKYYDNDEERYDEVPDILDYLYDMLDSAQDKYDDLKYESEGSLYEVQKRHIKNEMDAVVVSISMLTKLIDLVSEERCEYYYAKGLDIVPIQVISLPILTPDAVDGKLVWNDTGISVDVFAVPRIVGDVKDMCYIPLEEVDAKSVGKESVCFKGKGVCSDIYNPNDREYKLHKDFGYVGYSDLQEELSDVRFIKCRDCGEVIFGISGAGQRWYAENGLSIPKRCKKCRIKRV